MRVFTGVFIWVLLSEMLVGLGFLAGYYWIGGWQMGLLVTGAALLIMLLPWLGELRAQYDSASERVEVRMGWWGRVRYQRKPRAMLEVRACGIPWRRELDKPQASAEPSEPVPPAQPAAKKSRPPRRRWQVTPEKLGDFGRALLSALVASNDLIWDAREIRVQVDSPTEHKLPDQIIEKVVGHRGVDPIDIKLTAGDGKRHIRVRYRIGLFRAMVICVCAALQGRVWALKDARKPVPAPAGDSTSEDRKLIEELHKQLVEQDQAKEDEGRCPSLT